MRSPSKRNVWRSITAGALVVVWMAGTGVAAPTVAGASSYGSIQGYVRGPSHSGICVLATGPGGRTFTGTTGSTGGYLIPGLVPGQYTVEFGGCGTLPAGYVPEWYNGEPIAQTATPVTVTAGHITKQISGFVGPGGHIAGQVSNSTTGSDAVPGVCVSAVPAADPTGPAAATIHTGSAGRYDISGLVGGSYLVDFGGCAPSSPSYFPIWYGNQSNPANSTPVAVHPGGTTSGIDQGLAPAGVITGQLKKLPGRTLDPSDCVEALSTPTHGVAGEARTNSKGIYHLGPLASGTYLVEFTGCGDAYEVPEWYPNVFAESAATPVTVTVGQTTGHIGALMYQTGELVGRLVSNVSRWPSGVTLCVSEVDPSNPTGAPFSTETLLFGSSTQPRLHPWDVRIPYGTWLLEFASCSPSSLPPQWWKGQSSPSTATSVHVPAMGTVTGFSLSLDWPAAVSGVVFGSPGGARIGGVCVSATPYSDPTGPAAGTATTAANGTYKITGLPAGNYYYVEFGGCGIPAGWQTQWYQNSPTESGATKILAGANRTVTGIDAALLKS